MKKNYMNLKKLRASILGVALLTSGGLSAQLTVLDYNFTNGVQSFTVPTCVTSISVVAYGAEGVSVGNYNFATGKGGMASGVLSVVPGQVLNIYVGGQNGYNGGGTGQDGGNGGGASDIRVGGTAFANRVMVAGGGGGAGGDSWQCNVGTGDGGGGTVIGTNFVGGAGGAGYEYSSGCGGNGGNNGGSGATGYHGGGGGGGGFATGGIGAVPNGGGGAAGNGSLGLGGNSGYSSGCNSYGAGGGGGGYYGGGGAAGTNCGAGRGGGGSSWTGNLTSPAFQPGVRFGDGKIVLTFPTPSITVSQSNTFICLAQSATITAAGVTSYTWTGPAGVIGFNASAIVNPIVSTVYTVTGVSAVSGCQFVNTVAVAVDNLIMSVSANTAVCVGTPLTLSASGANNYLWSNGWPYPSVNITANASNVFTVSGIDANNCPISNTVAVTANPLPNVTVSATKTLICRGESISLNAGGASTYDWGTLGNGASISITPALNTVYIYTVVGTDANGCSKTGSIVVDVKTCTGVDEVSNKADIISIYPNPSNGTFNIQSDVKLKLNLVNQLGQVIKTISLDDSHKVVTVTDLADGVYFITGENNGNVINKKIVVSK